MGLEHVELAGAVGSVNDGDALPEVRFRALADTCPECLRRAWLLQMLSARLAYRARDPERLLLALALGDEDLIGALGGRRKTGVAGAPLAIPARPVATGRGSAADLPSRPPLPDRAAERR